MDLISQRKTGSLVFHTYGRMYFYSEEIHIHEWVEALRLDLKMTQKLVLIRSVTRAGAKEKTAETGLSSCGSTSAILSTTTLGKMS